MLFNLAVTVVGSNTKDCLSSKHATLAASPVAVCLCLHAANLIGRMDGARDLFLGMIHGKALQQCSQVMALKRWSKCAQQAHERSTDAAVNTSFSQGLTGSWRGLTLMGLVVGMTGLG